jgi:hypothetical protein
LRLCAGGADAYHIGRVWFWFLSIDRKHISLHAKIERALTIFFMRKIMSKSDIFHEGMVRPFFKRRRFLKKP